MRPESSLSQTLTTAVSGPRSIHLLWGALGIGSLVLRIAMIDRAPLDSHEAALAFAAWQAALGETGDSLVASGAPLLARLIAGLFWLFGASDVTARIVPALAGAALPLTPSLLTGLLGSRVTLTAGVLIAVSPIMVHLSQVADPAMMTALLAMVVVASAVRLATDRPAWAPWTFASGLGLALAHHPTVLLALLAAAAGALATWNLSRAQARGWLAALQGEAARGPIALGVGTAVVAATGGLMDLRGVGFMLGDVWTGLGAVAAPTTFPSRNLAALLAYAGPLIVLAAAGFVLDLRAGSRLALFLGQWTLLLLVLSMDFGQAVVAYAALPIAPAALLAAGALAHLPTRLATYRLSGAGWTVVALSIASGGAALVIVGHAAGADRPVPPFTALAGIGLGALTVEAWRRWASRADRVRAAVILGTLAFVVFSAGSIARLSFGGSPPGTEILKREETAPAFREMFEELNVLARGDERVVLVYDASTPIAARWYGRAISQLERGAAAPAGAIQFEAAPPLDAAGGQRTPGRTPWRTLSHLDRADLNVTGAAQWAVSRSGLVEGRPQDIIVVR
ncbi:MAG: hypothetical protein GEU73_07575 [Chloroflexi bacterium]|nr:hypothetical protein [Chloroflexota bacterium]